MQGTVLTLFGAALAAGMAELLLPNEDSGTVKLFRFLISLVILLLLLTPFSGFLQESETLFEEKLTFEEESTVELEEIFFETVQAQSKAEFEKRLYDLLEREYAIPQKNVTVLTRFDLQGELIGVSVYLSGSALLNDPQALQKSLTQKLGCTVEVR
jgi:hypothetical protein